ncbi:tRNA-specific 2-thiouridylase mnmA [Acidithiobacillus ferrivorans SS3]|uniref:tRNA-specific 2-thiouridylase MnmA n=1 Tax=Acidithiobacillus ferrivorans SS3 TaxID=743299 RepID=G0JNW8_9PROT|nr:tRNA 2-thiouridine(34) synthase MnmA [Acidithiobacillus ferrivorans]AEM47271.1 tRNA-specific 2-thiouridylase mnmA [Acidithiobacillus ferrivorans SS3]OFA16961.1 tRNA(5-methylaminomethyl-2-thiouridine)-methyltransferase [Acidithiobacillus ferrivorans]
MADPKALIALSGGVDSAVAAILMQEQGYELTGVTMRLWPKSRCCDEKDIEDAADVCARLDIPYTVLDYREAFRRQVVDVFVAEYQAGRTPNPCARCNQFLKFDALLMEGEKLGASLLATGHYARLAETPSGAALLRGRDDAKDQSYFLFAIGAPLLPRLRFPVGGMNKDEVRAMARKHGLPVAAKQDSQDICFVPDGDYRRFLEDYAGLDMAQEGEMVDSSGQLIGHHPGTLHFTVGQRRGLGGGSGQPRYVLALDPAQNRVIVGAENELYRRAASLDACNWLTDLSPGESHAVTVKLRYRSRAEPAILHLLPDARAELRFPEPQRAVTPGQAAVCYQGERLLGGGWIRNTE